MSGFPNDPTEQDYYDAIDDALNQSPDDHRFPFYPMDSVATPGEWRLFKRALLRWLAEQEAEHVRAFDQDAIEREHDDGE